MEKEEQEQKSAVIYPREGKVSAPAGIFVLPWILFILFLVYTAIGFAGFLLGYRLVLYCVPLQSAVIAGLFLVTAVTYFQRSVVLSAGSQIMITLLLPLTILVQIWLITRDGGPLQRILYFLCAVVSIICAASLFFQYRYGLAFKIIFGIFSALLALVWILAALAMSAVLLVEILTAVFGEFGKTTVVREVSSPSQHYIAEVVDVDLGATGGETQVNVKLTGQQKQRTKIPVLLGTLEPKLANGVNVYTGEWGEFDDMVIEWKDDDTLVIDGKEYAVE